MDATPDYVALWESAAYRDLSERGRLCILGADRAKFLNGQVTNNVKDLKTGEGCYAALVSAKGKIQCDLHIYALENELLLDFEPGMSAAVQERLEKFIIAEDAQVIDAAPHYGMWTVQGPKAAEAIGAVPEKLHAILKINESYIINRPRTPQGGYDLFVPISEMESTRRQLPAKAQPCTAETLETGRIEAALPRFGVDMDDSNLASEILDTRAISYSKGCYIGQEVIARVRTYGQVAKAWRGLRLPDALAGLPKKGDKLFLGDKEMGYITSATNSPHFKANLALGYARREGNQIGTELQLKTASETVPVKIVELPFN